MTTLERLTSLERIQEDEVTGEALYGGKWYECFADALEVSRQDLQDHTDHQDDVRDARRDEGRE